MIDLAQLKDQITNKLSGITSLIDLEETKSYFLGKKGLITVAFKNLGSVEASERKLQASELNIIKNDLIDRLNNLQNEYETKQINSNLNSEKLDITLPSKKIIKGKIHPVSQVIDELTSIFSEIGFSVAEGPDIENEYNNFTALNTPEHHPARDMHDTFYLDKNKKTLLRTHTSPVQIRTMLKNKPPIKIIVPGRTYRCDSDMTHTPMFHQLEGLYVDKNINQILKICQKLPFIILPKETGERQPIHISQLSAIINKELNLIRFSKDKSQQSILNIGGDEILSYEMILKSLLIKKNIKKSILTINSDFFFLILSPLLILNSRLYSELLRIKSDLSGFPKRHEYLKIPPKKFNDLI